MKTWRENSIINLSGIIRHCARYGNDYVNLVLTGTSWERYILIKTKIARQRGTQPTKSSAQTWVASVYTLNFYDVGNSKSRVAWNRNIDVAVLLGDSLFNFLRFQSKQASIVWQILISLKSYLAKWNLQSPHCSSTKYIVIFKTLKFESKSRHCITCLRFFKIHFSIFLWLCTLPDWNVEFCLKTLILNKCKSYLTCQTFVSVADAFDVWHCSTVTLWNV